MAHIVSTAQATEAGMVGSVRLKVAHILPDKNQPRKTFDPEKYEETKASIKAMGLQVPITVNLGPVIDGIQYYYIKYGENRWRIHVDLDLEEIDCVIDQRFYDGKLNVLRVLTQAAENINRIEHTPSEIASVYRLYFEETKKEAPWKKIGKIQEEFARIFGKSSQWVQNYASMANLRQEFLDRVDAKGPGQIPFMAAVALGRNPKERQTSILHGAEILAGSRRDMLYTYVLHGTHQAKRASGERVGARVLGTKQTLVRIPERLQDALDHFGAGMSPLDRQSYLRETMGQLTVEELKKMVSDLEGVTSAIESLKNSVEGRLEELSHTRPANIFYPLPQAETMETGGNSEEDGQQTNDEQSPEASVRSPWPDFSLREEDQPSGTGVRRVVNKGKY